ncbi:MULTISPECIES: transcriptional regulator [unclassified Oceanobacillus]|uniref:transcriptional regulator n=1 Tax=unclassified Oceanobacillus TaxID=2630292 RepID=UPI001BE8AD58|nr:MULTISPECIES: transcriptional regulator [unclassified Oceanobacillus]MBT2600960.1 transcriptional regulator [Oceanobacillus sp. ISL-74]MBT2653589.1 transcriptional regulator [Oceanobacillus sp. ISL-73]
MSVDYSLRKATFKHIESELYAYNETLKEIDRLRTEIMAGGKIEIDENTMGGANSVREIGRPTERIATRLLTHKTLRNLEEIATAINDVYNMVSDDHRKVIRLKYWYDRRLDWNGVADMANMHRNTATKLRKEVVLLIADKIGWR